MSIFKILLSKGIIIILLIHIEKYEIVFNETYKLTILSITIPVSSAACERTFSCLRRLLAPHKHY